MEKNFQVESTYLSNSFRKESEREKKKVSSRLPGLKNRRQWKVQASQCVNAVK